MQEQYLWKALITLRSQKESLIPSRILTFHIIIYCGITTVLLRICTNFGAWVVTDLSVTVVQIKKTLTKTRLYVHTTLCTTWARTTLDTQKIPRFFRGGITVPLFNHDLLRGLERACLFFDGTWMKVFSSLTFGYRMTSLVDLSQLISNLGRFDYRWPR